MKSRRGWLILLASLCWLPGCDQPAVGEIETSRPVRLHRVEGASAVERRSFVARTDAVQTLDLSFEVGGRMIDLGVREGQVLRRGALVARLDETDFRRNVRQAEVKLRQSALDLQRKRSLLERRVLPRASLEEAVATYNLDRLALERARYDLSHTQLKAPFDALVSQRFYDGFVNVRPGEPIVRLLDMTEIRIKLNVPEDLLATVSADDITAIDVHFPFLHGRRFPLEYREHANEADAVAQTYQVTLAMPRPVDVNLLPGMTGTVEVTLSGSTGSITIPAAALRATDGGDFAVWRYDPSTSRVTSLPVEVGGMRGDQAEVLAGLAGGEQILAAGVAHAREGMLVSPLTPATP